MQYPATGHGCARHQGHAQDTKTYCTVCRFGAIPMQELCWQSTALQGTQNVPGLCCNPQQLLSCGCPQLASALHAHTGAVGMSCIMEIKVM